MDDVDTIGDPLVPEPAEGLASIREPRNSVFLAALLGRFGTDAVTSHRVRDLSSGGALTAHLVADAIFTPPATEAA